MKRYIAQIVMELVKLSAGSRVVLGILTLGPGALCDTESCAKE